MAVTTENSVEYANTIASPPVMNKTADWHALTVVVGAATANKIWRGIMKSDRSETNHAEASTPIPGRKNFPGWGGNLDEETRERYDILGDDVIKILTEPLYRRGNKWTQEGNDIVVRECLDVLKTETPGLIGLIDHFAGASEDGKGKTPKPERRVDGQNAENPGKDASFPDMSIGGVINGKNIAAFINTASRNLRGDWTSWERFSLARLIYNAGDNFVAALRKLNKDDDREEYARDARKVCRDAMNYLQDRVNEENRKQDENKENDQDDQQAEEGKDE
jgi:hypothetical protein